MDPFTAVDQFHETFDLPRGTIPAFPNAAQRDLRIKLLQEEWEEYLLAETQDDLVEVADALADMIYIACGTAVAYGIPLDRVFAAVHESNMSKLVNGKVLRREDGKILKPTDWQPPDIGSLLKE